MKLPPLLLRAIIASLCLPVAAGSAGRVDFQLHVEPGSLWVGNHSAQAAMLSMLGQFEQTLRTSGAWDSTLEVFVTDNETSAYATGAPGSYVVAGHNGRQYRAPNAWQQIVRGAVEPNGAIQPNGAGRDLYVNWNPALSQPQSNIGLLRHELMHGMGMITGLDNPTMTLNGAVTRPGVGQEIIAYIMDAGLRDLNRNPLLGQYNGAYNRHVLSNYAVDDDWDDENESGIFFRGIGDDGANFDMPMNSRNPTSSSSVRNGGLGARRIG